MICHGRHTCTFSRSAPRSASLFKISFVPRKFLPPGRFLARMRWSTMLKIPTVPESQHTANDKKPHGTSHTSSSSFRSALRSTAQASSAFWFWIHLRRKLSRHVPELAMPMWSNMIQYKPISLDVLGSESHSSIDNLAIVLAPHILVERKVPPCSVRTGAGPDADRASNFQAKASTLQD